MRISISVSSALAFVLSGAHGQGDQSDVESCSGSNLIYRLGDTGHCFDSWLNREGETLEYPEDFEKLSYTEIYSCPSVGKRIIKSNGIPDHNVKMFRNRAKICEVPYAVELPLNPQYDENTPKTEIPIRGMIAMALNGVPAYGPQEAEGTNAVTGQDVPDAQYWYGHPTGASAWHVHNPNMGEETVTSEDFLGYAFDGFPIYGPLNDTEVHSLDECNGLYDESDGSYKYHVRTIAQVNSTKPYCNDDEPVNNWNYVLGCYSGIVNPRTTETVQSWNTTTYSLPEDCELEYSSLDVTPTPTGSPIEPTPTGSPTESGTTGPTANKGRRPNIIIMQPDDLVFLDEWTPPPNNPTTPNSVNNYPDWDPNAFPDFPDVGMPNINRLKMDGVQMMQAYTASPVCGTSRYSTITGKMPSRAASIRKKYNGEEPSQVTIPTTKLLDFGGQNDCSEENLAQAMNTSGYATGMFGKWHLTKFLSTSYSYDEAVESIKECGFSTVGGLYIENMLEDDGVNHYDDGSFSHNMEWITWEAIGFINETSKTDQPFFMYFNPTVPHGSNDVEKALVNFTCHNTADYENPLPYGYTSDPWIKGMTEDGCENYRQTVLGRAGNNYHDLGKIWLDDSVGALLHALQDNGQLENTIFVFQEDHGMDTKGTLFEGGIRIPQFVHYPNGIEPGEFHGLVSTVDIAATMMDYAGITPPYDLDGKSWKNAIGNPSDEDYWENDRCLFFEVEQDRAVRCGCYKYIDISDVDSTSYTRGGEKGLNVSLDGLLFDLCDGGDDYITKMEENQEVHNLRDVLGSKKDELVGFLQCHLNHTHVSNTPDPTDFELCGAVAAPTETPISDETSSPTGSPTFVPTESPTASPTVSPTANPTEDPTSSPTSGPTASPTASPTKSPTTSPTSNPTSNPTANPTPGPTSGMCSDSPFKLKVKILQDDGSLKKKNKTCDWIAQKKKEYDEDPENPDTIDYCNNDEFGTTYWTHCRAACGRCDECENSKKQKFKIEVEHKDNSKKKNKTCSWVKKNMGSCFLNGQALNSCCDDPNIAVTCPFNCGVCQK